MLEIIKEVKEWLNNGETSIVIGILINLQGSAVRGRGAVMAVNRSGIMAGSVSGGCIESTVLSVAERVFETGQAEIIKFCQIDDEILGSISPCGGEVTVSVGFLDTLIFDSFCKLAEDGRGGKWGLISLGPEKHIGSMFIMDSEGNFMPGSFNSKENLSEDIKLNIENQLIKTNETSIRSIGNYEIFSAVLKPGPQLIIVGASHIGIALSSIAELTGYRVTVIDPRTAFARDQRFSKTIRLLKTWPRKAFKEISFNPYTAIAVITHDTKIDDQALKLGFKTESFYIGALGSSSTHKDRVERLIIDGVSEDECKNIHSPIGLNIKSANPEEIALSIMAEVVKEYREAYGKS
ncbi:MAG: XdhC family protein [Spirochaetia bacterium]|jgi:xanthine dehydrogenase accessory factor|nr:XdhC family protein [Spirochaetia bacterium]